MKLNVVIAIATFVFSPVAMSADNNGQEPAQNATISIDGQNHRIVVGTPSRITVGGKSREFSVNISPYRDFSKAGVNFKYLSQRHFSYDKLSAAVDHWSLDGNNTIIMVQHYKVPVTRKDIIKQFHEQFKAMKAGIKQTNTKIKTKSGTIKGDRLHITLGNIRLTQEIFVIEDSKATRTFILQDTVPDKGGNSQEYHDTRKVIERTLSL